MNHKAIKEVYNLNKILKYLKDKTVLQFMCKYRQKILTMFFMFWSRKHRGGFNK